MLTAIKTVVGIATSLGAGSIVGNVIQVTTPTNIGAAKKATMFLGGVTLSYMAGKMAEKLVKEEIDELAEEIAKLKDASKKEN